MIHITLRILLQVFKRYLLPPSLRIAAGEDWRYLALVIGGALVIGTAALQVTVATTLLLGAVVAKWHFPFFIVATFGVAFIAARRYWKARYLPYFLTSLVIVTAITGAAITFSAMAFDLGSDSQTDHIHGILHLANNWNPVHDPYFKLINEVTPPEYVMRDYAFNDYVTNSAVKGTYFAGAAVYKFIGLLETGKSFNIILLTATWLLCSVAASEYGISRFWAVLLGAVTTIMPVSITQVFTHYVDAFQGWTLSCIIVVGLMLVRTNSRFLAVTLGAATMLALTTKLPGMFFGGFMALAMFIYIRYVAKQYRGFRSLATAALLGTIVIGYSPMVENVVSRGGLFFFVEQEIKKFGPTFGHYFWRGQADWINTTNPVTRIATSLFSETHANPEKITIKLPFRLTDQEVKSYTHLNPDHRIGGFGPWMSGALVIAGIVILLAFARALPGRWAVMYLVGAILVSALVHPGAFWARFAPHIYFIPILIAAFGLRRPFRDDIGAFARVTILVLTINSGIVGAAYLWGFVNVQMAIRNTLGVAGQLPKPLNIYISNFGYLRERLREAGVTEFRKVPLNECKSYLWFVRSEFQICFKRPIPKAVFDAVRPLKDRDKVMAKAGLNFSIVRNMP